jgi:hypothetical protein
MQIFRFLIKLLEAFNYETNSISFITNLLLPSPFQVWFQNQRAKVKKIQKKQLKEGTKPKDTESQEESENESKMSVKIKDENSSELWGIEESNFKDEILSSTFFPSRLLNLFAEARKKGLFQ